MLKLTEINGLENYGLQNKVIHLYKNFDTKNRIITTTKNDASREVSVPDLCQNLLMI